MSQQTGQALQQQAGTCPLASVPATPHHGAAAQVLQAQVAKDGGQQLCGWGKEAGVGQSPPAPAAPHCLQHPLKRASAGLSPQHPPKSRLSLPSPKRGGSGAAAAHRRALPARSRARWSAPSPWPAPPAPPPPAVPAPPCLQLQDERGRACFEGGGISGGSSGGGWRAGHPPGAPLAGLRGYDQLAAEFDRPKGARSGAAAQPHPGRPTAGATDCRGHPASVYSSLHRCQAPASAPGPHLPSPRLISSSSSPSCLLFGRLQAC